MFATLTATRSRQAALAIGAAVLATAVVAPTAEAKSYKRFGIHVYVGGPGVHWHGGHGWRRCRWLKRRAIWTGSRKWWRRYRMCRRGYW